MSFDPPTEKDVRLVFDTSLETQFIEAFIEDAHGVVQSLLSDKGLTASELKRITKYLTCGFLELRDPRASSKRAAGQSVEYLQNSYIETAVALDTTGTLRRHFADADEAGDRVQLVSMTRAGPQDADPGVTSEERD